MGIGNLINKLLAPSSVLFSSPEATNPFKKEVCLCPIPIIPTGL